MRFGKNMKSICAVAVAISMICSSVSVHPVVSSAAVKAKKITLNKTKLNLNVGDKAKIKVKKVTPKGAGKAVKYVSASKKIAKVSKKGVVNAVSEGKTKITVTSKSNKKAKNVVKVTVRDNTAQQQPQEPQQPQTQPITPVNPPADNNGTGGGGSAQTSGPELTATPAPVLPDNPVITNEPVITDEPEQPTEKPVITEEPVMTEKPTPEVLPTKKPKVICNFDFEDGMVPDDPLVDYMGTTAEIVDKNSDVYGDNEIHSKCLKISNRSKGTGGWWENNYFTFNMKNFEPGKTYEISVDVWHDNGPADDEEDLKAWADAKQEPLLDGDDMRAFKLATYFSDGSSDYDYLPDDEKKNVTPMYYQVGDVAGVISGGEWGRIAGTLTIKKDTAGKDYFVRVFMGYNEELMNNGGCFKVKNTEDYYMDNFTIKEYAAATPTCEPTQRPTPTPFGLPREALKDNADFAVGTVINRDKTYDKNFTALATQQFEVVSFENEMKGYSLIDVGASQAAVASEGEGVVKCHFDVADEMVQWAVDNGLKVHGHVLFWEQSMANAFFYKGYDESGQLIDAETLKARMKSYAEQVITHFEKTFPGEVVAWDVVQEAINADSSEKDPTTNLNIHKDGKFYQIMGGEYIKYAFECAKAARDAVNKDIQLFYNDFNCFQSPKTRYIRNLINYLNADENNRLLDCMGMEGYVLTYWPNASDVKSAMEKFANLGVKVGINEFGVRLSPQYSSDGKTVTDADIAAHAQKSEDMFKVFCDFNKAHPGVLTNVSIRALFDRPDLMSEVDKPEADRHYDYSIYGTHSGLFDANYNAKEAFWRVIDVLKMDYDQPRPTAIPTRKPTPKPTATPIPTPTNEPYEKDIDISSVVPINPEDADNCLTYDVETGTLIARNLEGILVPIGEDVVPDETVEITIYGSAKSPSGDAPIRVWLSDSQNPFNTNYSDIQNPAEWGRTYSYTAYETSTGIQIKKVAYDAENFKELVITRITVKKSWRDPKPEITETPTPTSTPLPDDDESESSDIVSLDLSNASVPMWQSNPGSFTYLDDGSVELTWSENADDYAGVTLDFPAMDISEYSYIVVDAVGDNMTFLVQDATRQEPEWGNPLDIIQHYGQSFPAVIKLDESEFGKRVDVNGDPPDFKNVGKICFAKGTEDIAKKLIVKSVKLYKYASDIPASLLR